MKTDLHLLPQNTTETATDGNSERSFERDIMVFEQHSDYTSHVASRARFRFLGLYCLEKIQILEPKSPELVRMLEQKWTRTNKWGKSRQIQRDSVAWQKSLGYRWAILKFKAIEGADLQLSLSKIEVSQPENRTRSKENIPSMSVNEMLRGLRLKDQVKTSIEVEDK